MSIIQLFLSFIILISCAIERYPITVNRNVSSLSYDLINSARNNAGFPNKEFMAFYNNLANKAYSYFSPDNAKESWLVSMALIIFDFENIYNLLYLVITAYSFNNHLLYSFLLLDIVKRSEDLQNVISSITTNVFNLIIFSLLGIIIMYIYGIIGYQSFKDDYDDANGGVSESFILTITSTIKKGLLNGGGIADSMSPV